jgi:hypothetical protein
MAIGLCAWLAFPTVARDGMAVVLLAALLPVPLLVWRAPVLWSVPAAAPLLAAAGAGPAYAAVAGQATTWRRRAALGAIGFLWVALAEAAIRHPLVFGLAHSQQPRGDWLHNGWHALGHAVVPVFASPVLLCAAGWAACAAVLPLLVRGHRLAVDVLGATVWAVALYISTAGVQDLLGKGAPARGAAAGAAAAAVLAVAAAAARRSRSGGAVRPNPVP